MKTCGVSGIRKFRLLVFLGHPCVYFYNFHCEYLVSQMSYRKDVLEQKLKKVTDEIGYKSTVKYKASLIAVIRNALQIIFNI